MIIRNVILLTQFALVYLLISFLQLWSLEMVCIHKSYIVQGYFEISVVLIGHGFSFFVHGKVMENQCWKRGGTVGSSCCIYSILAMPQVVKSVCFNSYYSCTCLFDIRVATNLENLEYSGISLNMENSENSVQPPGKIVTNKVFLVRHSNICVKQLLTG